MGAVIYTSNRHSIISYLFSWKLSTY